MMFFGGKTPTQIVVQVEHTLELDLPPGIRSSADPTPSIIWVFWMHDYQPEGKALEVLSSFSVLDIDVQLVTPDILPQYNVTEDPFHDAFKHLAPNHKLDYLHAYFMHHYGGGFLELKPRRDNTTLTNQFDYISSNDSYWVLGSKSQDVAECDESDIDDAWCKELQFKADGVTYADTILGMSSWEHSKGPCCAKVLNYYNGTGVLPRHDGYIMRKETSFTEDWLKLVHAHLTAKLPELQKNVAPSEPCCMTQRAGYPLRWEELRGEIWAPLLMKYRSHLRFDQSLL
jgi:hypothetical protein